MIKSTSIDVTLEGTWFNRVAAKQEDRYFPALADKQINEYRYIQSPPTTADN